jgi:3-mercaptopyruvate sulfurtransferase SseA
MEMEGGFAAWEKADLEMEREPMNRLKQATNRLFHRHSS